MNFGAIGYVIGHEITHGFDDQGRQFDVKGNLRDWWQPDTQKAFVKKAQCIIDQYGNYTDRATGLNVSLTIFIISKFVILTRCLFFVQSAEWNQYTGREHS